MINLKFESETDWQDVCSEFVSKHVHACVSGLVDTLAQGAQRNDLTGDRNLSDLVEEAFELFRPSVSASDRLEALRAEGYRVVELDDGTFVVTDQSDEDAYESALDAKDYVLEEIEPGTWGYYNVEDGGSVTHDIKPDYLGQILAPNKLSALRAACSSLDLTPDYDPIGEGDDEAEALADAFENEPDFEDKAQEHAGEIYEHWVVSDYLAYQLEKRGERVGRLDNLIIWGRGCTGQAIKLDGVIREIVKEWHK